MAAVASALEGPYSLTGLATRDLHEIVAETRYMADDLRGACLLVTGATGWFGTWLLEGLLALNRVESLDLSIVALSRWPDRFAKIHPALHAAAEITWIAGDVRDAQLSIDAPLTHVIHAATASSAAAATQPDVLFDTIVEGTRNVFACARRQRARRFLFVSSGAVYGRQSRGITRLAEASFDASSPVPDISKESDAYTRGKRKAESDLLAAMADGDPAVSIARCFAFVGPHMPFDTHFAIGNFIRDANEGWPIHIAGDGTPRRSYLYMSDLVVWLLVMLVYGVPGRGYNVGSPDAITVRALADRCAALASPSSSVVVAGRAGGFDYVPDVSRACGELGLSVGVSLDEAIARTVRWSASRDASVFHREVS